MESSDSRGARMSPAPLRPEDLRCSRLRPPSRLTMNSLRSALTAVLAGPKIHRSGRRGTVKERAWLPAIRQRGRLRRSPIIGRRMALGREQLSKRGETRTQTGLAIFQPVLASYGLCDGGISRCIRYFVSRLAGYSNSNFCDTSSPRRGDAANE